MAPSDNHRAVWLAMAACAAMIAHHVASKAVRDALFLTSFEVSALPVMVIVASVFSIVSVLATSRAMTRFTPARLVPVAFGTSAVLLMGVWLAIDHFPRACAVVLYIEIVGLGSLLTSGFWSVLNERFDPRTAKQQIGRIAGAGTFGGIIGGVAAERMAAMFSTSSVVPVLAAYHIFCAVVLGRLAAERGAPSGGRPVAEEPQTGPQRSSWRVLMDAPYLRTLATLVLLGTVSAAMIDFVFKSQAVAFHGRGENLTRFFALFYSASGVLTFLVQMTSSSTALRRLGLAKTVGTLPFAVSMGGLGALVIPGLGSATIARALEAVFRGSLFRSGYELFYTPIPTNEKRAAKSVVDVGFDRLGDALGSGLVTLMLNLGPMIASHAILTAAILVALAGVWFASRLHGAYIDALERGLIERAGALDLNEVGDSVALTGILESMTVVYPTTAFPTPGKGGPRSRRPSQAATQSDTDIVVRAPQESRPPTPAPAAAAPAGSVLSDPVLQWIADLRSGEIERVRRSLQENTPLKAALVPHVIALLAWDQAYPDAARSIQAVVHLHGGQLVDGLLDEGTDFSIRRRLPRLLTASPNQRTVDGLLAGLNDKRFEVRFQCGRALTVCVDRGVQLRVEPAGIFDAIRREVAVSRPVWESHRLLDRAEEREASPFVDEFLRNRSSRSLEHVFTLLSLVLPAEPLRIAFKGLHTDDPQLRGTSLEYLESILPPDVRERLWPLLESKAAGAPRRDARPLDQVIDELMKSNQSIIVNLGELRRKTPSTSEPG